MIEEFSVAQFLVDGTYEYIARRVGAEEAVHAAKLATESLGAQTGLVTRLIITDSGDNTVFEWKHGEGVTYPPQDSK
jgi:hypothetical protein